mmetsp:Transcript_46780/g.77149  ORF Transcript_46780/g.77149 Transcript_46780/m.77149 type:complete len:405 (+) Transcript_46780:55-1269(+)
MLDLRAIETQYLQLLDDLPVSQLLDRLERLHRFVPPDSRPDLVPPATAPDQRCSAPVEPMDNLYSHLDEGLHPFVGAPVLDWPSQQAVPVCQRPDGSKVMYIVHLFSGRRRERDCHYWFNHLKQHYFPDIDIILLSLDTAVCGPLGNLLDGPGLVTLWKMIHGAMIAGSLSGPPCETWSAARHLPPPPDIGSLFWPRPLRSSKEPWGLLGLGIRELKQLDTGSALMLSNIKIELGIVLHGGASMMEHPAPSPDPAHASTWRTSIQETFCSAAPGAQRLHFQQWKYGAPAIKPTTLRLMGLPPMARHFHAQALPTAVRPDGVLAGKNPDTGQFRTACAKEYPDHLCRALADTMLAGLARRRLQHGVRISHESQLGERDLFWLAAVTEASARCSATSFLPDYQPVR